MARLLNCAFALALLGLGVPAAPAQTADNSREISIVWGQNPKSGRVTVSNGELDRITLSYGKGKISGDTFRFSSDTAGRLDLRLVRANVNPGSDPCKVTLWTVRDSFSFYLRDVTGEYPICIPGYSVAVLPGADPRTFRQVGNEIAARGLRTKLEAIAEAPETSFEIAARQNRKITAPIRLGLSRDMRLFEIAEELPESFLEEKVITPLNATSEVKLPETDNKPVKYHYALGRGVGAKDNIRRRLDEGTLPIYHSVMRDDDVEYHTVAFVSPEIAALTAGSNRGTDYRLSDLYSNRVFPAEERDAVRAAAAALTYEEQAVLYTRTVIVNHGQVPRYAWMKVPKPGGRVSYTFDTQTGFSSYSADRVFCVAKLNGDILRNEEISILLQPGQSASFEFYLPHEPIPHRRAEALRATAFDRKYAESKAYWQAKLAQAGRMSVPEKRIAEMIDAGLLHLDLFTYGQEPGGILAPNVGVYGPIGTESAPIIQYYLSMGWNDVARRSLGYFLDTQQPDGRIENFNGYTVETGAALWMFGEYYRYTLDAEWIREIKPAVLKACEYLMAWRERNKKEELRGRGYGMIEGRVADPVEPYHQFVLNGYSCMGLQRVGEALRAVGAPEADALLAEAAAWKADIRASFFNVAARSPAVPLGDGTWGATAPPWTELTAPRLLYEENKAYRSHGTFTAQDALLGPLYLVFCEILRPDEPAAERLFRYQSELLYQENSAFSQPYYSRHNWYQAHKGMVKPFLNTYYNTFSALVDRETYTFWEHFYKLSVHKTHEEAWFLMETRQMLYMEAGDSLHLLRVIPRAWLEDGKEIVLDDVRSYFGAVNLRVKSHTDRSGHIEAHLQCDPARKPAAVTLRLPHPQGKRAVRITGGSYDPDTETVTLEAFSGEATVKIEF